MSSSKKIINSLIEKEKIKVFIRKRPLMKQEIGKTDIIIIKNDVFKNIYIKF